MTGRYRRVAALICFVCCVLCSTLSVTAAVADQEKRHLIKVGYIDYDGFITEEKDGTYTGYGVEYLRKIAEYTGWEYEFEYDSWDQQLKKLETGEIDMICQAQRTKEREKQYLFSDYAIGAETSVLYVSKENDIYYYNDYAAYNGMRVGMLRDSFQNQEFRDYAAEKGFSYEESIYDTQEACFGALDRGEIDAVAMGSLALKTDYKIICRFGSDPFYIMTGRQNKELLAEVNEALGQIAEAGASFQTDLYQKYYGEKEAEGEVVFTREEAEYIQGSGVITVAFIASRAPLSYRNAEGNVDGITVDILDLLSERSGLTFQYVMMPQGMRTADYLSKYPDSLVAGVLSDNPDFQKEPYILTDSFYTDDVALVGRNGQEYDVDADDVSYRLAIPASYVGLEHYIQMNAPQFEICEEKNLEDCLAMVLDGKADFAAQNVSVLTPYLANPYYEELAAVPTFFMEENTGIVGLDSEEHRMLIKILNKCIGMISEKEIAQFKVDHTLATAYEPTLSDMVYKFRYPIAVIGILLLQIVAWMVAFELLRRRNYHKLEEKNEQLAVAVAQANSANEAKGQFLARMSHEIRTPINAIVGLTEIARHRSDEGGGVEECLDKIDTSSKVLLAIVNDVLDMSAIESNKIKIAQAPFSLKEVLDSISAVYGTQCVQKKIAFTVEMDEVQVEQVQGDVLRLNQVLLNLISNAYKFTPEGGSIRVTVSELPMQQEQFFYKFVVTDTGEGMSEEMQERLFLPFEQEEAETAQHHGGSGLGLSIAKNLVELMGGSISCQSKKGVGTTFTVSLPLAHAVDEKKQKAEETGEGEAEEDASESYDFGGRRILLAEDTEMNAEIVTELLELVNMHVDHAWNGEEAVERYMESAPGTYMAVLMDVQMPGMNGYEAAKAIRAQKSSRPDAGEIPIYAMTANAYTEDISAALNAGMNGHIAKPVDTAALYRLLKKSMEETE